MDDDHNLEWARASLVLQARQSGIMDHSVLNALESIPREIFVSADYMDHAYSDASLPLPHQQAMISPIKLATLLDALDLSDAPSKILEIGTGSGYATALLSKRAKRVFTVERHKELLRAASQRWRQLGLSNIIELHDDGLNGWQHQAPFPRILLSGSVTSIPDAILSQLDEGGVLVAAIGAGTEMQKICRYTKLDGQFDTEELGQIRISPLVSGKV